MGVVEGSDVIITPDKGCQSFASLGSTTKVAMTVSKTHVAQNRSSSPEFAPIKHISKAFETMQVRIPPVSRIVNINVSQ